jgi:hypothetical protein
MADGFEQDPSKMLGAIRGLLPKEIDAQVIDVTAMHLQAIRELARGQPPLTLEATPVNSDVIEADVQPAIPESKFR